MPDKARKVYIAWQWPMRFGIKKVFHDGLHTVYNFGPLQFEIF